MCGFRGELSVKDRVDCLALAGITEMMLKPRGPDSDGLFVQGRIRLGHQLLSILGLGASSQQPMIDPDLGLGIVFKGIDNFRELKGHSKLWQAAVLEYWLQANGL